jgi:hypothetical protein
MIFFSLGWQPGFRRRYPVPINDKYGEFKMYAKILKF